MNFFRGPSKKQVNDQAPAPAPAQAPTPAPSYGATNGNQAEAAAAASPTEKADKKDAAYWKEKAINEKAGKRKLYHALVKLAEELNRVQSESKPLQAHADYANQAWYQGGLWRAPQLLPGVEQEVAKTQRARPRQAVSLSDLFFNLVTVTGFTRVGLAITYSGTVTRDSLLYFAVFWTIWSKEASYTTRFDTTDLSAKAGTLVTCFAVLFASLSVSMPIDSTGGIRVSMMAAFCSSLHFALMARVFWWHRNAEFNSLDETVKSYALYNTTMNFLETITWIAGITFVSPENRWITFTLGVLLALRVPRAVLANDFHAACTKRGVIFILLLGFMLQSVVVVATEFFQYDVPDLEQYSFIGASCFLLFCIKLLYVDDSSTLASDHALLVNRTAALFFNLGQFVLLFSTTIMGSGLSLLTHSYLAATAALPGNEKKLVCGGFAAVLLSTTFIKSMHLKRVPVAQPQKAMFIGAYALQAVATLCVAALSISMCFGQGGYLQVLMHSDVELMWILCGFAFFLVVLSWLDEGLELALNGADNEQRTEEYLVHPFGFWWCLKPEVGMDEILADSVTSPRNSRGRLSELSPLLGESVANMRMSMMRESWSGGNLPGV